MVTTSSRIDPNNASFKPICWSSNLGHNTPGVSKSSRSLSNLIHCRLFVTPGLSAVLAAFLLAKVLIIVDLPTLGIPHTMARKALGLIPRRFCFSIKEAHKVLEACTIAAL